MSKKAPITDRDIYVSSERKFSDKETGEYLYNVWFYGNQELSEISADDAREVIACLQHALDVNEKGGQR
jgi:hypothetical protein